MTTPAPPVSRALMAAVIIMGVMIVVGVAGLIGVIAHRALSGGTAAHHGVSIPPKTGGASSGGARPGFVYHATGHIVSQSVRPDGSVVLLISNPEGEQVVVWNPDTGLVTAQFSVTP
ncbi:hypothetical protein C0V97_03395 [Asaia sp. W19]|uniref:hypothetical protein n=1 Tax=unclassified Asaia TaxID=2685023 RepID=UPI000F8CDB99|nr:hypothetical protein [Asaia sp. W19]RUT27262.1 hypothetical protein C0V97_03395 [Asaia sp. W19]